MKYRLPDGRQVQRKLGPAWTGRGRPATGYFTKRLADDQLQAVLDQARRGTLPGMVRTGVTFAEAAAEWLRHVEQDRGRKPSTVRGYRSAFEAHLLPAFGSIRVEDVTTEVIERWLVAVDGSQRTKAKLLIELHGIFGRARKAYGLRENPVDDVEKFSARASGEIQVFSPEEVAALLLWDDGALSAARGLGVGLGQVGPPYGRPSRIADLPGMTPHG